MRLNDRIELKQVHLEFDSKLNEVEVESWVSIGKCAIMPNTAAKMTKGNDGKEYLYAYEVIMKKPKQDENLPRENSEIRLTKSDGTVDKVCRVRGFVTLRNWLKIWV